MRLLPADPDAQHGDFVSGGNRRFERPAIFSQLRQFGSNIELIAPASFISVAIPLCVFFAFQRYFVQGLLAGSVK